jgi:hypothetical protein
MIYVIIMMVNIIMKVNILRIHLYNIIFYKNVISRLLHRHDNNHHGE